MIVKTWVLFEVLYSCAFSCYLLCSCSPSRIDGDGGQGVYGGFGERSKRFLVLVFQSLSLSDEAMMMTRPLMGLCTVLDSHWIA
jgi:hypothetical protein